MSGDGTTVAYDDIDAEPTARRCGGRRVDGRAAPASLTGPRRGRGVRGLSYDGSLLLYGGQPIEVWDVAAGTRLAAFDGHVGGSGYATFSRRRGLCCRPVSTATCANGTSRRETSSRVFPGIGEGPVAATSDGRILTIGHSGSNATPPLLIDVGAHGELGAVDTCAGIVAPDSLKVAGDLAVFHTACNGRTQRNHLRRRRAGAAGSVHAARAPGASTRRVPGRHHVRPPRRRGNESTVRSSSATSAPVQSSSSSKDCAAGMLLRPSTRHSSPVHGISAGAVRHLCATSHVVARRDDDRRRRGGRGRRGRDRRVGCHNRRAAVRRSTRPGPPLVFDVRFTPDTEQLLTTSNDQKHRVISTRTWEVVSTGIGSTNVGIVGFSPDGRRARRTAADAPHRGIAALVRRRHAADRADEKRHPRGMAVVSDAQSRRHTCRHRRIRRARTRLGRRHPRTRARDPARRTRRSSGVAFVDDQHLAVTPRDGDLVLVTIDQDELLEIVRRSLTRGFTATECSRSASPTSARRWPSFADFADSSDDPAVLDGAFEIRWTDQQFEDALAAPASRRSERIRLPADGYPGTYTVTFDDGRFDIVHDEKGVFCTGSYTVTGDRVQLFAERRELAVRMPTGPIPRRHVRPRRRRADVDERDRPPRRRGALHQPTARGGVSEG